MKVCVCIIWLRLKIIYSKDFASHQGEYIVDHVSPNKISKICTFLKGFETSEGHSLCCAIPSSNHIELVGKHGF